MYASIGFKPNLSQLLCTNKEDWCRLLCGFSLHGSTARVHCIFWWPQQCHSAHKDHCKYPESTRPNEHHLSSGYIDRQCVHVCWAGG